MPSFSLHALFEDPSPNTAISLGPGGVKQFNIRIWDEADGKKEKKKICLKWQEMRGSIPCLGRPPGGGNGNPLQHSCLESPMDRGAWWGYSPGGPKESDMTERLILSPSSPEHQLTDLLSAGLLAHEGVVIRSLRLGMFSVAYHFRDQVAFENCDCVDPGPAGSGCAPIQGSGERDLCDQPWEQTAGDAHGHGLERAVEWAETGRRAGVESSQLHSFLLEGVTSPNLCLFKHCPETPSRVFLAFT